MFEDEIKVPKDAKNLMKICFLLLVITPIENQEIQMD